MPSTSINVDHASPAFDPRASLLKVSGNYNLAAVSIFLKETITMTRVMGLWEGCASSKSSWFHGYRTVVFKKDNVSKEGKLVAQEWHWNHIQGKFLQPYR